MDLHRLTGDRHRADDLLQTALEKLYLAWPRVQEIEHRDAYVRRILVRADIDDSRRPWRRETTTDSLDEGAVLDDSGTVDLRDQLARALGGLTPMQRRCVVLRHWLDLSVADTAAELGVSEGTVRAYTSRGVAHLQRALASSGSGRS